MSLRSRLLFSIFGTLLLSLAAGAAFTYWHAVKKIETEMQAAIAVGGRFAHNAVDDAEEPIKPQRRLRLLVADFDGDRHLRASLIVGGKVVGLSDLAKPESPAPAWFYRLMTVHGEGMLTGALLAVVGALGSCCGRPSRSA